MHTIKQKFTTHFVHTRTCKYLIVYIHTHTQSYVHTHVEGVERASYITLHFSTAIFPNVTIIGADKSSVLRLAVV